MQSITGSRRPPWRLIAVFALALLVVGGAIAGYTYLTRDTNVIPKELRADLTFSPLVLPASVTAYTTSDYKFSTAEDNVQILSYIITIKDGTKITVSEYTQPPQFTDIPEYKQRFLTNVAKQYDTVQTSNGTVYLGRLSKQNDRQLAIMLEKGLLVLMSPEKDLDAATWRGLVEQFEIQKSN